MVLKRYTSTDSLAYPPIMLMKRPTDLRMRMLEAYMTVGAPLRVRLQLLVVPTNVSMALIEKSRRPEGIRLMTLSKRIQNITYVNSAQAIRICHDAVWLTPYFKFTFETVTENCPSFLGHRATTSIQKNIFESRKRLFKRCDSSVFYILICSS